MKKSDGVAMKCEKHVRLVFSNPLLDPCAICACEAECGASAAPSFAADAANRVAVVADRGPSAIANYGLAVVPGSGDAGAWSHG